MQVVILAGGFGTRLGSLAAGLPKAMVDINEKPFLEHQLALLSDRGIKDIVLCVGHLAERIEQYFGDGRRFGVRIRYSMEKGSLLGTAGAVKQADPLLDDVFFLTYADSYLRMDYKASFKALSCSRQLGLMVIFRNEDRYERSNVVVEDGLISAYDKVNKLPGMNYINFGVSVLRKEALALVPEGLPYSQEEWYQALIKNRGLGAFETTERFYEIGSPEGLAEFRRLAGAEVLP